MNRSLITGLTLASVAGSGGAFAAVAASQGASPAAAQSQAPFVESALVQQPVPTTVPSATFSYEVGTAGTVTLTATNGSLTINDTAVGAGWTLANATAPGTHIEVQYTDSMQLVTFGADLVGSNVVVSVTNVAAPGSVTTAAPEPITVVQKTTPVHNSTVQPQPATPQATAPPAEAQPPTRAATTAPSGSGTSDDQNDDNEKESNDD
jgi:hypothetical protein